jgi:alpha-L-rhamnosidase
VILVTATPGAWFFEGLGGILPDYKHPGFKHFTLRPGVVKSVDWVKCSYQSPYGNIVSNWKLADGSFTWDISVPVNSTATVYVPGKNITEGGLPAAKAKGVTFLRMDKNRAVFKVGSGSYEFVSRYFE